MTAPAHKPDLRRIGESAFTEVLGVLLSLPATPGNSAGSSTVSPVQITGTVPLAGQRLAGTVRLQLPRAFVAHAVRLLTGLDGHAAEADPVLEDTAGELANMVAGRVAVQLTSEGFPCSLGTPSVSRVACLANERSPGADLGQAALFCDGHRLSVQVECRYAPA
jgi:CheY-specific phosphatase CheX